MAYKSQSQRSSTTGGQHAFSQIAKAEIQRSSFNRSCGIKTTFDAGFLIPIFCDEALPGDTMSLRMNTFGRLATPLVSFMDNLWLDSHFFAVPVRLLWSDWQKFNGEQIDPGDSTEFLVPEIDAGPSGVAELSVSDYIGIPPNIPDIKFSALWHRAYNLIWNEWFRDENLQDSVKVNRDAGPDPVGDVVLLRRGKRHDYFTSCLPFPQKGPSLALPLGESAPVITTDSDIKVYSLTDTGEKQLAGVSGNKTIQALGSNWTDSSVLRFGTATGLEADLTNATASTINEIREAFQIQRLFERDARGGSRYTEIVRSHFGVTSPDQRLQRPEYLGGGTQNISVHPVPQTSSTVPSLNTLGTVGAFATTSGSNHAFNKSFTEHCIIIGMVSVRADLAYQQGLNRMFSRRTRFDFYWPALSHIGEQAVLNKEIDIRDVGEGTNELVFGYQERWAEYRYKPSMITGRFRSNAAVPLDIWHLAQDFVTVPTLSADFIEDKPPVKRVIIIQNEPDLLFDAFFDIKHARPMPTFSTPGLVDHF